MAAISSSSPLILFGKIGRLDLLRGVFGNILIPPAVQQEVLLAGAGRPGTAEIAAASWIVLRRAAAAAPVDPEIARLEAGEAEVIALGLALEAEVPVLLDDDAARRLAEKRGLQRIGSAGVLVLAKNERLIFDVREDLDRLRAAGLYLGEAAYRAVLTLAGEASG
ncbi:MAG: DUF3368 domain-containing protein [Dehalococcoidia bacterium]